MERCANNLLGRQALFVPYALQGKQFDSGDYVKPVRGNITAASDKKQLLEVTYEMAGKVFRECFFYCQIGQEVAICGR